MASVLNKTVTSMGTNSFNIQHLLTCTIFLSIVLSCNSTDPSPVNDYFPLTEGFSWKYKVMTDCECDCPCAGFEDLMQQLQYFNTMTVKGDTVLDGKSYKQIRNRDGWTFKFMRREGEAYYERGYYGDEFKILDASLPVGGSWKQTGFDWEIVSTIRSVRKTFKINNKLYRNVIELENALYHTNSGAIDDCAKITTFSYYAPGLGEVYMYRPYNRCTYYSGDTHNYLVSAR
jgi:hypothetical protein